MKDPGTNAHVSVEAMSGERKDFVKRLFAVTISVGFATQIARIIAQLDQSAGTWHLLVSITTQQWHELALLFASLVAVVASWEGYLTSIHRDPLETPLRFYLDVVIVFVYLLLMLFSAKSDLWFALLVVMFAIYFIWDLVKIRDRAFKAKHTGERVETIPVSKNGAVTTAVWLAAVAALYHFKYLGAPLGFLLAWLAALYILVMYRVDKYLRSGWLIKAALIALPLILIGLSAKMR